MGSTFKTHGDAQEFLDSLEFGTTNTEARKLLAQRLGEELEIEMKPTSEEDELDKLFEQPTSGKENDGKLFTL
jgi:hypothetical protein